MTMTATRLPAGLTIRRYEPGDRDAVWLLHREGVMQTTPQYSAALPGYEDDLADIERTYLGEGCNFWVVEGAGGLIGMTAIMRIDAETARLRRMRVTEAWRKHGIARALLETAEAFCREAGYMRLILDTTEQQTAAHALYESAGFVRTGERSLGPFRVFDYLKELR
jgi:GNAT superfamily N-acetyltransferase